MKSFLFLMVLSTALVPLAIGYAQITPTPNHPDVEAARERFQDEFEEATTSVVGRYKTILERLEKSLTRKGDLNGALAVSAEFNKLKANTWSCVSPNPFTGTWTVRYTNKITRTYKFLDNGTVEVLEGTHRWPATLAPHDLGAKILFADGKIETVSGRQSIVLLHYMDKDQYKSGRPAVHGFGERTASP
jgi:hypothetical protein